MTGGGRVRQWLAIYGFPALALALWLSAVVFAYVVGRSTGHEIPTCMFKRVTGYPCATCGGTRTAALLAKGDITDAFAMNPLVAFFLLASPLLIVVWLWRRRFTMRQVRRPSSSRWLVLFLMVLVLNWWYVIAHGR